MNISYDNQKIADLIKSLIFTAYDMPSGKESVNLQQSSISDVNNYLKSSFDPSFLNNTSFYDNYADFENTLSTAVQETIAGKPLKYNLVVSAYNKLVRYLDSGLNYNSLSNSEKAIVDNEMTKLISNVQAVKKFTKDTGPTQMYNIALQNIEDNLGNHIYALVTIELKKTLEALKKKLDDDDKKITELIKTYKKTPSTKPKTIELLKFKIKSFYDKYLELYKRVARLFSKADRQNLKINSRSFNKDINDILGVDNSELLKLLSSAQTAPDSGTVLGDATKALEESKKEDRKEDGDEDEDENEDEKASPDMVEAYKKRIAEQEKAPASTSTNTESVKLEDIDVFKTFDGDIRAMYETYEEPTQSTLLALQYILFFLRTNNGESGINSIRTREAKYITKLLDFNYGRNKDEFKSNLYMKLATDKKKYTEIITSEVKKLTSPTSTESVAEAVAEAVATKTVESEEDKKLRLKSIEDLQKYSKDLKDQIMVSNDFLNKVLEIKEGEVFNLNFGRTTLNYIFYLLNIVEPTTFQKSPTKEYMQKFYNEHLNTELNTYRQNGTLQSKLDIINNRMSQLNEALKQNNEEIARLEAIGSGKRKRGRPMKGKGLVKDISMNIISPVLKYLYSKLDKSDKAKIQKKKDMVDNLTKNNVTFVEAGKMKRKTKRF